MRENQCSYLRVLLLSSYFLSTLGAKLANPTKIKNLAAIPLFGNRYLESLLHGIPIQHNIKLSVSPAGLYVSLKPSCVSLLRLWEASMALCITPVASAWMTQVFLALHSVCFLCVYLPLLLCWSLSAVPASLPRTHYASL